MKGILVKFNNQYYTLIRKINDNYIMITNDLHTIIVPINKVKFLIINKTIGDIIHHENNM